MVVLVSFLAYDLWFFYHKRRQETNLQQAGERLAKLREDVCQAMEKKPEYLSCTHRVLNVFKTSEDFHRCSAVLYVATIDALHQILLYYQTKVRGKLFIFVDAMY